MTEPSSLREALVAADPRLSKYSPLSRILFFDDFNYGVNGWCELIGNHDGDLGKVRPVVSDMRPVQISNLSFWDVGSHGAMSGNYALKLATRPRKNHMALAIKRLTSRRPGRVRFETYFTFKAEGWVGARADAAKFDGNVDVSAYDFGDFCFGNDIAEAEHGPRYHCALRYANTDRDGKLVRKWQYKTSVQTTTKMEVSGSSPVLDYHVADPDDWADIPGGTQPLCYNELPSKVNWHYLRYDFDTAEGRNVELQVNDKVMDLREIPVPKYDHGYWGLERLMNFSIDVRTHGNVRNFLFLDSCVASVEW